MKGRCTFIFAVIIPMCLFNPKSQDEITESPKDGCYEEDTDYPRNDLNLDTGSNKDRRESPAECQKLCTQREGCKFFTWKKASNECWLKTVGGHGKGNHEKSSVSGPRFCDLSQLEVCDEPRHKIRKRYSITITNQLHRDVTGKITLKDEEIDYKIKAEGVYESKLISSEDTAIVNAYADIGEIEFKLVPKGSPGDLATLAEVRANEQKVKNLLSRWTIALLDGGKIFGPGHGGKIVEGDFSGQVGEKLIILSGKSKKCKASNEPTEQGTTVDFYKIVQVDNSDCVVEEDIPEGFKLNIQGFTCG